MSVLRRACRVAHEQACEGRDSAVSHAAIASSAADSVGIYLGRCMPSADLARQECRRAGAQAASARRAAALAAAAVPISAAAVDMAPLDPTVLELDARTRVAAAEAKLAAGRARRSARAARRRSAAGVEGGGIK